MRSYVNARANSGEFITPNEINDEIREIVGTLHSIDRDNIPANVITPAKCALGAWGNLLLSTTEQVIAIVHPQSGHVGRIYGIPFDVSGGVTIPWIKQFPTGDAELEIGLSVGFTDDVDELPWFLWAGVRVDGLLAGRSPMQTEGTYRDHVYLSFSTPVGAGTHVIEPVYGISTQLRTVGGTLSFTDRQLSVLEKAR